MRHRCIELSSDSNFLSLLPSTPRHQIDVLPGHLEVLEELDEEEDEYTKQKHAARKRQMTAGRSSPDKVRCCTLNYLYNHFSHAPFLSVPNLNWDRRLI